MTWWLQVPCLPFLPLLSITTNSCLMAQLGAGAWLRYLLWMALGKPCALLCPVGGEWVVERCLLY